MKRKTLILTGVTAGLFLPALSGCATGQDGASADGAGDDGQLQAVSVGVMPVTATAPIYLGEKQGFFEEEGLELELHSSEGGASNLPAVVSGNMDFAYSNVLTVLVAADEGLGLEFVTVGASEVEESPGSTAVVAFDDAGISSAKDLEGVSVSVNTLSNIGDTTIRYAVDQDGGDSSTVDFLEIGFPDALAALETGQIDAAWVAEPFVTQAENAGAEIVTYTYIDTYPGLNIGGYFSSEEADPELVEKFTTAMNRSLEYAESNPDEVREIVGDYTEISSEIREVMQLPDFSPGFNREAMEVLGEAAVEYGTLSEEPDLDALLPEEAQ